MTIHLFERLIPSWIVAFEGSPRITSWMQTYDPSHRWWLSTLWAALPLVILLAAMIGLRLKGHISALVALAVALIVAVGIFHMPMNLAVLSTILGAGYGLFPIYHAILQIFLADNRVHTLYDDYDRGTDGPCFHHAILRHGYYSRSGFCADRNLLSFLRHIDRVARHRLHGLGYFLKRPLRKPAKVHRAATRNLAVHHGFSHSGGGVMGKMVAPQSVVVASTATGIYGSEGSILRFVFIHSFILACLMGVLVSLVVYFPSLTKLILT